MKRRHKGCGVTAILADDPIVKVIPIAKQRVSGMLLNMRRMEYNLEQLAVSAYLQGMEDMASVAFRCGFIPPGSMPPDIDDQSFLGEGI